MTQRADLPARAGLTPTDRMLIALIVVLASVFPVDLEPSSRRHAAGADGQFSGVQGEVVVVPISVNGTPEEVSGRFLGRRVPFFADPRSEKPGDYLGLVGIDMLDQPGVHELSVEIVAPKKAHLMSYSILVVEKRFPLQRLTLPRDQVDLDRKSLIRVKAEQRRVREALGYVVENRLWNGDFVEPLEGTVSGAFGRKRIINGQPRSPHSGEDISAPEGTDVVATNGGVVRLTADHFFSGKGIFIDHGLGLHSMYFHLSEILVREGQVVRRGQVIGRVGATGRATGPHLHWGIRLNGARVNPYALTKLSLNGSTPGRPTTR